MGPSPRVSDEDATKCGGYLAIGRVIDQAVSCQLPTAEARVRAQVTLCAICGGQNTNGAGFLRVLRFPLPILIPPTASHSSSIILGWYNRPVSGQVNTPRN
jgi:hypothetical protein